MKVSIKIVLIALLSFGAEQVFPWWSVVICAALVSALIPTRGGNAFLAGFLGVGLLWLVAALFYSYRNDFVLSGRIAELFSVYSSFFIILISALVGGLAGGMGALTGNQLRQLVQYQSPYSSRYKYRNDAKE